MRGVVPVAGRQWNPIPRSSRLIQPVSASRLSYSCPNWSARVSSPSGSQRVRGDRNRYMAVASCSRTRV